MINLFVLCLQFSSALLVWSVTFGSVCRSDRKDESLSSINKCNGYYIGKRLNSRLNSKQPINCVHCCLLVSCITDVTVLGIETGA